MLGAGKKWSHILSENRLSSDGYSIQGSPVKRIPHGNGLVTSRDYTCEFEGYTDGFSSTRAEKAFIQIRRCDFRQFFSQVDGHTICISSSTKG